MPTTIKLDLSNVAQIAKERGLIPGGDAQKKLSSEILRHSAPYTPFSRGELTRSGKIAEDGTYIQYNAPYARYLWYGCLMVGRTGSAWAKLGEKKSLKTPLRKLSFSGAPKRGPRWVRRMWQERGTEIVRAVAKEAGGKAK